MLARKLLYSSLLIILIVLLDQSSKTYLISHLKEQPGYYMELLPFLDFVYAWNYGASFGMFGDYYQYSNYAFLFVNLLIVIFLIFILAKSNNAIHSFAYSIVIGGALGNIIDRAIRGAVFDFIYLHYGDYDFPAFNVADSFITIGAFLYLAHVYLVQKDY